jgi:hypothetical protein
VRDFAEMLSAWNSFYVMIGSAAAALTGLMFVVITLVSGANRSPSEAGVATFSTPTVVHFCCVLFTSACMSVPFRSLVPVAILLGLAGTGGIVYVLRIARQTAELESYRPDAEDWCWHVLLPLIAYAALLTSALMLRAGAAPALYAPAVAVILLIFVGIHNAWDVVTYIAVAPEPKD